MKKINHNTPLTHMSFSPQGHGGAKSTGGGGVRGFGYAIPAPGISHVKQGRLHKGHGHAGKGKGPVGYGADPATYPGSLF